MSFTKLLSLILAGAMGLQSVALAQVDRTAGIETEHIRTAKENIKALKTDLLALDQALISAAETIEKRGNKKHFSSTILTGAALGLGLSVYATFSLRSRGGEMNGILGLLAASTGLIMSAASAGSSALDQAVQPKVDIKDLKEYLNQAENEVRAALTTTTEKSSIALLKKLEGNFNSVRATLSSFEKDDSSHRKNRLLAQITQAAGAAITVYGMNRHNSKAQIMGSLIMNAGNIGQIIGTLTDSQADQVLKEINSTRRALMAAAVALE